MSAPLRYRKNDPAHNVFVAVNRWIKSKGGAALVMSGIEIITFPPDFERTFHVAVKVTGRRPKSEATNSPRLM